MSVKQYYSFRHGKRSHSLILEQLLALFDLSYGELVNEGYFLEWLGYSSIYQDKMGPLFIAPPFSQPRKYAYVLRKLRKPNLWPVSMWVHSYSENDLFDIIELLHAHVSKATKVGEYENKTIYEYDQAEGQAHFREVVNDLLKDYDAGYVLSEAGEILLLGLPDAEELLEAELPDHDPENVEQRVKMAVEKYRRSRDSMGDRRDAIRDLGDVLEFLRPSVKSVLSKDESDLFNILNNFSIRHHRPSQKTDYEDGIWLEWLFYHYLAGMIHACIRLIKRQEENDES